MTQSILFLSRPVLALQALIASSANFQTLVSAGVGNPAAANVYFQEARDAQTEPAGNFADPLPRAIIFIEPGSSIFRKGPGNWESDTKIQFALQAIPPAMYENAPCLGSNTQEAIWFLETAEQILNDMMANSGGNDGEGNSYANAVEFSIAQGPMPCEKSEFGLYFWGIDFRVKLV